MAIRGRVIDSCCKMNSVCCCVSSASSETQACRLTAGKAAAYIDDSAKTVTNLVTIHHVIKDLLAPAD
jgi:hypothetical protein